MGHKFLLPAYKSCPHPKEALADPAASQCMLAEAIELPFVEFQRVFLRGREILELGK